MTLSHQNKNASKGDILVKKLDQSPKNSDVTFGQKLADAMAAKVGSWGFLIGQTIVLTGWVGANTIPGMPHWDQSPFILLNLVFSFASAYTAPVVLMSQNRQSDEDREQSANNHLVNLRTAESIELLHRKLDELQSRVSIAESTPFPSQSENKTAATILPLVHFDGSVFRNLAIDPKVKNMTLNLYQHSIDPKVKNMTLNLYQQQNSKEP
jgi:uncharacterized membrane protein